MAWYVHTSFNRDVSGALAFQLADSSSMMRPLPGASQNWLHQIMSTARVDPLPDLVAVRLQDDLAPAPLPDFLTIVMQYVVSSRFMELVEALEPGVHQFIPIKIQDTAATETYGIVNVLRPINAALNGQAVARLQEIGRIPSREQQKRTLGASYNFIDRNAVAGFHLWRSDFMGTSTDLYFSEELMRRIKAAGLRGLKARPSVEVDLE